jgi:multidrug efflux system membrane fusion protein
MGPKGAFVYVVQADSTVAVRSIAVTQVDSGTALIGKGLKAGENIVTSLQSKLSPGAKVTVESGSPGEMTAQEPELGAEGIGSNGTTSGPIGGIAPR